MRGSEFNRLIGASRAVLEYGWATPPNINWSSPWKTNKYVKP